MSTASLHVGSIVQRDGRLWTVAEVHASRMLLRSSTKAMVVSVEELLDDVSTVFANEEQVAGDDCGALIDGLSDEQREAWRNKVGHVREVLTGYRSGISEVPRPGEPKPCYQPTVAMTARCKAKAQELGISDKTVSHWAAEYRKDGPAALIDHRGTRAHGPLAGLDARWVDMCRRVCAELTEASSHTKKYVLFEVDARLRAEHGGGDVRVPGRTRAYEALDEITRGRNMFRGSAKGRREIAGRPQGCTGNCARPGWGSTSSSTPIASTCTRWIG